MTEKKMYDVIIIGAGPAGLSAGIYSSRYKLKTLILDDMPGGLAKDAHRVENYPGIESISGLDLMENMKSHAKNSGAEIIHDSVVDIKKENDEFCVITGEDTTYYSEFLIIATGSKRKKLGIPGEDKLYGRGVSYCATCDAAFFKDKDAAVVGGANSAIMAAVLLAEYAKKVYLIYRGAEFRAEPTWNERVYNNPKIELIYNTNVKEVIGEKKLEKITLDNGREINVSGLFIEVGSLPSTDIARRIGVEVDNNHLIKVSSNNKTNVDNVYAAGDVTNGSSGFQQIVTSVSEGSIAAYNIFKQKKKKVKYD